MALKYLLVSHLPCQKPCFIAGDNLVLLLRVAGPVADKADLLPVVAQLP